MCEVKLVCSSTKLIVMARFYAEVFKIPQTPPPPSSWYSCCHSTSSPRSWTQPYHTIHSETGVTLLIWPWSVKIAGEDLSLSPQIPTKLSRIPLRTLWNNEDITDAPLVCGADRLKKCTKSSWHPPVPQDVMNNSRNFILVWKLV